MLLRASCRLKALPDLTLYRKYSVFILHEEIHFAYFLAIEIKLFVKAMSLQELGNEILADCTFICTFSNLKK